MEKKALLFVLGFFLFFAYGEEIKIQFCLLNGSSVFKEYDSAVKNLVLFDDGNKVTGIKGLENFKNLESVEFYNFAFIDDYSFLQKIKSCNSLYFSCCKYFDFNTLYMIKNLKYISFQGYVDDSDFDSIMKKGIDVSKLKYLDKIEIDFLNRQSDEKINIRYRNNVSVFHK